MANDLEQLEDLVKEINETKHMGGISVPNTTMTTPISTEEITDDNINEFILKKSTKLIAQGLDTVDKLKDSVTGGVLDAEELDAYSKLITSVAGSIEILNKINIQNKKSKATKELKELEITNSKNMLDKYNAPKQIENQTNNIYIGTREKVMEMLAEMEASKKTIDVTSVDTPDEKK